jgi:putative flippase GtrA
MAPFWSLVKRARELMDALRDADGGVVHQLVSNLSQSQRLLAPLALAVGGIDMLVSAVRMLVLNWRLMLVQVLPVALTWLAMYDLKAHALAGNSDPGLQGPILIAIALAIITVTAASFFMNSVFAFAVSQPGKPQVRPAITQARCHLGVILGSGAVVGLMLAVATTVISRDHRPWFVLALGAAIGVMMLGYVAVPARLIGIKPDASRRDKLSASIVAGAVGVAVAAPPYVLGRVGVLMLGVRLLFIPGLAVVTVAVALEAGAAVAVKSVKMISKLVAGERPGTVET